MIAEVNNEFRAKEAITALLNSREKANVKLRWPLPSATIEVNDPVLQRSLEKFSDMICEYANVKRLDFKMVEALGRELKPVFTKIGPEFKADAQTVAEALRKEDADKVEREVAASGHYSLHTDRGLFDITAEHFTVSEKLENPDAVPFKHGMAYVDKQVSEALMEEAMVREFERRVQLARKEAGLKKSDRITLHYQVGASLAGIVKRNSSEIKRYVNAKAMHDSIKDSAKSKEFDLEEEKILLEIEKAQ